MVRMISEEEQASVMLHLPPLRPRQAGEGNEDQKSYYGERVPATLMP